MTTYCRLLTKADIKDIPIHMELFNSALETMAKEMHCGMEMTTPFIQHIKRQMRLNLDINNPNMRYVAHYTNNELDGQLFEEVHPYDANDKMAVISWIAAKQQRRGVGAELIKNCLDRALSENTKRVTAAVSTFNQPALALYTKMGFHPYKIYREEKMIGFRRIL